MKPILAFVDEVYEDLELWYPMLRLREAAWQVVMAGTTLETIRGKHGYPARADVLIHSVREEEFSGLVIPGGFMPDKLRRDPAVLQLTREMAMSGRMVAFVCHGGWIPISAKVLKGRRATGSLGIRDDLENAGAIWVDEPVVIDGNFISSRTPKDLPQFGKALVEFMGEYGG